MKKIYQFSRKVNVRLRLCTLTLCILFISAGLNAQLSYTFTAAGVTGPTGPTQTQINTAYSSTNLNGSVTVSSGIQSFTIPVSGPYRITAIGAQGAYNGGYGAYIAGTFTFTAGTVLKILVGQTGTQVTNSSNYISGGGGGGSFIASTTNSPYIVAGGGGGNGDGYTGTPVTCCYNGMQATTVTAANPYPGGSNGGSGGYGGSCNGWTAGSGAGFYGSGSLCNAGSASISFTAGGAGGTGYGSAGNGGFGGGGGASDSGVGQRGGGGGGYSGGGGGVANSGNDAAGGGGGSYNGGTSPTNSVSTNTGNGRVIIELLCNISLTASTPNPTLPVICTGNSVTLTTNAIANYSWSTGNTTNSVIVVTPTTNTTYSVSGTSSANCTAYNAITVTVSPGPPVLSVSNPSNNICLGDSSILTASGALSYTWTNGILNGVYFKPTSTITYTVYGQNGCGTTNTVATVTVSPLQIQAIASSTQVCASNVATLTAGGASTYTWTSGTQTITGTSIYVAPPMQTVYTVTGSIGGCVGTTSITIATKANPTLNIVATASTVCAGSTVGISVSGADTYTWIPAFLSGTNVVVTPSAPTLYQVSGTNSLGCVTGTSQVVITNPSPTVNVVSNKALICPNAAVILTASGDAHAYAWTGGPSTKSFSVNPSASASYTVTGSYTNSPFCSTTKTIMVNVFQPVLSLTGGGTVCPGDAVVLTAGPGSNYIWSNGNSFNTNAITVNPVQTSVYSVSATVTSSNNQVSCDASNSVTVGVFAKPVVTAASSRTNICRGEKVTLTGGGAATYTWSGTIGSGASATFSSNLIMVHDITVIGTDANNCKDTASVSVKVNSCTGLNEFTATSLKLYPNPNAGSFVVEGIENISLEIINELGQVVRTVDLNGENSHQVNVNGLPAGIYFLKAAGTQSQLNHKVIVN